MDDSQAKDQPPVLYDRSFWGIAITQFLGAFNDNVYKQLVLLLAIPAGAGVAANEDWQGWATFVFSLPFVLFSGFAGYLSDRWSKTPIIVASKVAEIAIMILGVIAFLNYDSWGMAGTWTVLFLMATQSTFFGPGKYGILPELFRSSDLPRANGLILMSTFLAIIFGFTIAGKLVDVLVGPNVQDNASRLWIGSLVCVGIAVVGTLTSLEIRRTPPAQPQAVFTRDNFGLSRDMIQLLRGDNPLLMALLVSCVFWMVASIAMPTVNRVGIGMLGLNNADTSLLVGMIAIGIMLGAPLGGFLCRKLPKHTAVSLGLWGIVICLALLGLWQGNGLWLGLNATRVTLIVLGVSAAIYSIPLQVFLQDRPPDKLKGRMIATMNQANFLGMLVAGPLYSLFLLIADKMGWPVSSVFWMIGLMVMPIAILYRMGGRAHPET
ncbi:MAG: MFS transporter [Pirellula sp.]|jgi:acyl-[acyl-carrier-protein]-phospholipid O-acyltransferase/long-chain-fatty-acid--[acyl-carrier-protein] ligase|nr:MFS transporter [Pirellula sp.]